MNSLNKNLKYIGIGGCIIAIIGIFLPWISALGITGALIERLGIWLVLLLVSTGILFFFDSALFALIVSIMSIIWLVADAITIFNNPIITISPSYGLFVIAIGLIIALVSSIAMLISHKKGGSYGQF